MFEDLSLSLGPQHRERTRREPVRNDQLHRIEELRFDAVRPVVAQLAPIERVRSRDVEREQQLAGLARRRRRLRRVCGTARLDSSERCRS
jgi:hypothetical protein